MKIIKNKKIYQVLLTILLLVIAAFVGAGFYFFNVACVPGHKSFIKPNSTVLKRKDPLYSQKKWYYDHAKQKWYITAASGNFKLDANYLAYKKSNKTVIILHGYMNNKDSMAAYAGLFHGLGYNLLLPDARSHGQSQGKYIGYGWVEKADVVKWINQVLKRQPHQKIVLFGVSMGAATAMMTSGEKLPQQVKAIIEDCGYSNVKAEIEHEAQDLYHMPVVPRVPLVEILSGINRVKVGYFLNDGSAVNQLKHNYRPTLFIHGSRDTFVPTEMVYENYRASQGPKELWVVPGAKHAKSFATHPQAYRQHVEKFLHKYLP
ncbi:alpha/beta hydrolase [Lactobacillus gigeriorum]|uniref:Alpha beta hydrolase n=1 Tax=Lactobacillus gigeriorum DSM 23908 = CRBIP 24.85 TaxID=1423751 RepID=I7J365_9LACO|nr:alpha/beta hydrolase [Lactobacillus gigeriorum]KRN14894.1 alpha beta hydrolase [Lactobacillus gigeriorum DSM 23908 = CRBIP 24.85]CCI87357.1 Alpha/beta hydrolase [Lactobacillus gigeriorum DSM 23908 = CRBIP 24.85]